MFLQPKDLVWLDPCDEHRDEVIKQAAAAFPNLKKACPPVFSTTCNLQQKGNP
jgi:hypothetical protein